MTEVVVDGALDVVEVLIVVGVQTPAVGALGPFLGGYLDKRPLLLHWLPEQELQYDLTSTHHSENSKHWRDSGHELVKKQSATWSRQEDTALPQDRLSLMKGKGFEHQFPITYSQVGTGATAVHGVTLVVEVLNVVSDADEVMMLDVILLLDGEPGVEVVFDGVLELEGLVDEITV